MKRSTKITTIQQLVYLHHFWFQFEKKCVVCKTRRDRYDEC